MRVFTPRVGGFEYHAFYRWADAVSFAFGVLADDPFWMTQLRVGRYSTKPLNARAAQQLDG